MAESDGSSGRASQLPKSEVTVSININTKLPRRQLTLIAITVLLNVLLWSSLCTLIISVYLIAADTDDTTNVPSEVLTLTSALVSIAYIVLHTIFSLKQRIWKHQRRHPSIIKKTSYIAIRLAVTLCILWLLTSGWNFITVARRPVCLPSGPGLAGWEAGTTCAVGRLGIAMSLIALIASCTLFGMLSIVRRPFEAHLLKNGYRQPVHPHPTPTLSRRPSPSRSVSFVSDKYRGRVSASTHRSSPSHHSNIDVETIDLDSASPPSTIHSPSPVRSIGLGIFTCHAQPPPLPPAFMMPSRASSLETPPPIFYPSVSYQHLPPPPRMSALVAPSGFVPLSIPLQYSASAWRAVHPTIPSPLGSTASRSQPHLPHIGQGYNFTHGSRYSRSSVSLTRPHRLSSATPAGSVTWSSRSGSTGPDEGQGSPASGSASVADRATSNTIAYAILNGTQIPGTDVPRGRKVGHVRHASAPDPTISAQQSGRKAKGWKPRLQGQEETAEGQPANMIRSSSAELLSKFSPDSSPADNLSLRHEFEKELDLRLSLAKGLPFRKSRSASPLRYSDVPGGAANVSRATTISRLPQYPKIWKNEDGGDKGAGAKAEARRMTLDELKNKPLPKIAAL